jgi:hypothetical protein
MKPTDKAILGMVSESPGRNVSELRSGLDKKIIRRPSPLWSGEGSMTWRRLTEAACHFGGAVGTCVKKARKRRAVRRDEGRPLGVALQEEASNCQELLQSKAAVVIVPGQKAWHL